MPISQLYQYFQNHASFRSHIARKHINYSKSDLKQEFTVLNIIHDADKGEYDSDNELKNDTGEIFGNQFCNIFALFLLHIPEECVVPVSSIQKIVVNIAKFSHLSSEDTASTVSNILRTANVDEEVVRNVISTIVEESSLTNSCSVLKSDYLRTRFNKENCEYVPSVSYSLGRNDSGKECSFEYIPIKECQISVFV